MKGLAQIVTDVAQSAKTPPSVSGATITLGGATWMQMIPSIVGVLASTAGFILSVILIFNQLKKWKYEKADRAERLLRNKEEHEIKIQILEKELER